MSWTGIIPASVILDEIRAREAKKKLRKKPKKAKIKVRARK